jgi:prepilin-type N-terminal cleavage/methylation domain-containing protein
LRHLEHLLQQRISPSQGRRVAIVAGDSQVQTVKPVTRGTHFWRASMHADSQQKRYSYRQRKLASRAHPGQRGFTMVEIMVSIGLAASLSLVAIPKMSALFGEYQLASAVSQISADIGRARVQAVAQNRVVRLRLLDSDTYVIERSRDGVNFETYGAVVQLPAPVRAGEGEGPTFNRTGLAQAVSTLTLTDGSNSKTVRTNLVGGVSIS